MPAKWRKIVEVLHGEREIALAQRGANQPHLQFRILILAQCNNEGHKITG